jgi:hypothetical protein
LDHLVVQKLLEPIDQGNLYALASHLRDRYQSTLPAKKAESRQTEGRVEAESLLSKIVQSLAAEPLSKAEIASAIGKKKVDGQLNDSVRTLLGEGLVEYTLPDKPQSRLQRYRLTEKGRQMVGSGKPKESRK